MGRCGGNHDPLTAFETEFDVPGIFDLVYKDLSLVLYTQSHSVAVVRTISLRPIVGEVSRLFICGCACALAADSDLFSFQVDWRISREYVRVAAVQRLGSVGTRGGARSRTGTEETWDRL